MTKLDEALARFDRLIHSPAYQDLAWAHALQKQLAERQLMPGGRAICPVLRPHLLSRRQYDSLQKTAAVLSAAMDRVSEQAIADPALLARLQLLPAERMLAAVNHTHGRAAAITLTANCPAAGHSITGVSADPPASIVYTEQLSDLFYESAPMKELRKRLKFTRGKSVKKLLQSVLAAYKGHGKKKFPCIGVVEFRQSLKAAPSTEALLLAELFRSNGYPAEVVTPEQLEYRNGELRRGDFTIDIVYRRVSAQELLVRSDLNHPLLRAYRDHAICMVNSFRAEVAGKATILALLGDETILAQFPAAERKLLRQHIPWTRFMANAKTTRGNEQVDLPEWVVRNKESLQLRPLDTGSDLHTFDGATLEQGMWERAVKTALRSRYVVQEKTPTERARFPVFQFGRLEMRDFRVSVQPALFSGKMDSAAADVEDVTSTFSLLNGLTPAFVLE
ncbi:MAG: hypothetical protein IT163_03065 [Bryobacterales bacterium]|nr:hypothetical protein [Bryobacterales bacterium]